MAPEMGLGSPDVDWRADIYALACVGYWLLTATPVFDLGSSPMQVLMDHIQKQPPSPSERTTASIPPALDYILLQCLSKDPNDRPQTMRELAERLAAVPLPEPWTQERARLWWLDNGSKATPEKIPALVTAQDLAILPHADQPQVN
jgi:serine/threonine-protein kinase